MPDSGKFKDLYLNSAHTYPCQPAGTPTAPQGAVFAPAEQFRLKAPKTRPGAVSGRN